MAPRLFETPRQRIVLRQHQGEAAEQRPRDAEAAPPALERALGHAGVDQRQRDVARRAFKNEVRPDLGLGEDRQIRPPVVEEAAHVLRGVERHILMHRARTQALGGQLRRGHRAGREQERQCRAAVSTAPSSAAGWRWSPRRWRHGTRPAVPAASAGSAGRGAPWRRAGSSLPRRSRSRGAAASTGRDKRCQRSVRLEAHAGLGAAGEFRFGVARDGSAPRALIGQCRSGVQGLLDRLPVDLEVVGIGRARHVHRLADREAEVGPRQVQRHAAPAVERDVARRGDRHRQDRAAGLARDHDDAEACACAPRRPERPRSWQPCGPRAASAPRPCRRGRRLCPCRALAAPAPRMSWMPKWRSAAPISSASRCRASITSASNPGYLTAAAA